MIKDNFNLLETEGLFSGSDKKYLYEIKDSISHDERAKEIFNKLINDEYKNLRIRRKRKRLKLLFLSCILIILLGVGVFTGLAGMFNLMEFIFPLWLLYLLINEISENSLFFGCLVYSISGDEEKYLNDVIDDGMKEETFEPIIRGNSVYIEKDGKIMDVTNQVKVEMSNLIHIGYKNKIKIGKYDVYEFERHQQRHLRQQPYVCLFLIHILFSSRSRPALIVGYRAYLVNTLQERLRFQIRCKPSSNRLLSYSLCEADESVSELLCVSESF